VAIVDGKIRCSDCETFKSTSEYPPSKVKRGSGECNPCSAARRRLKCRTDGHARRKNADSSGRSYAKHREKISERARLLRLANLEEHRAADRAWWNANANTDKFKKRRKERYMPDKYKDYALRKTYGISIESYNAMIESQGRVCAICLKCFSKNKKKPHVDHCHATGKIRGILCHNCNLGIGQFEDNVEHLSNAIQYLERARQ